MTKYLLVLTKEGSPNDKFKKLSYLPIPPLSPKKIFYLTTLSGIFQSIAKGKWMKCAINLAHFLFNLSQKENQVKILDPCLWPGGSYKFRSVLVLPVCLSRSFLGIDFLVFSDMQLVLETCMRL